MLKCEDDEKEYIENKKYELRETISTLESEIKIAELRLDSLVNYKDKLYEDLEKLHSIKDK